MTASAVYNVHRDPKKSSPVDPMSFFGGGSSSSSQDGVRDAEDIHADLQKVVAAMQQNGRAHPLHKPPK